MSQNKYQLVYTGTLVQGVDLATAKSNVAGLFKSTEDKIAPLFSGKKVIVKKDLDQATAEKYKQAMQKAGALCQIEPMGSAPVVEPPQQSSNQQEATPENEVKAETPKSTATTGSSPASDLDHASIAPPGTVIVEAEKVEAFDIDISGMDMAEAGEIIREPEVIQAPVIDTGSLGMEEVGIDLVQQEQVEPVTIDTSGLDMAEAGEVIVEPEEVKPAVIDTSGIDMADPGEDILKKD